MAVRAALGEQSVIWACQRIVVAVKDRNHRATVAMTPTSAGDLRSVLRWRMRSAETGDGATPGSAIYVDLEHCAHVNDKAQGSQRTPRETY